jgi:hypothetical protein
LKYSITRKDFPSVEPAAEVQYALQPYNATQNQHYRLPGQYSMTRKSFSGDEKE